MGNETHFEKVVGVVEKSVEAWSKAYTKIDELSKNIDRLTQEIKDLDNIIRQKPCIIETTKFIQLETKLLNQCEDIKEQQDILLKKLEDSEKDRKDTTNIEKQVTLWLKLATGAIILIGTIIGTLVAFIK